MLDAISQRFRTMAENSRCWIEIQSITLFVIRLWVICCSPLLSELYMNDKIHDVKKAKEKYQLMGKGLV